MGHAADHQKRGPSSRFQTTADEHCTCARAERGHGLRLYEPRREAVPLSALSVAFWGAALLIDPRGEFPLNDDFAYALPVRSLVQDGVLEFTNWQSMPLLTHVLFGAAFCLPFGFSLEALRFSTLVAGWLGIMGTYALVRQAGAPRPIAAIAAATVLSNPIYLGLSCTFMTDVPFFAAMVWAGAAWLRAEHTSSTGWYVVSTGLVLWATLGRQLGIALPIAWIVVSAIRHGLGRRFLLTAVLPAAVVVATLRGYEAWVEATIGLPDLYRTKSDALAAALGDLLLLRGLRLPVERSALALAYAGLFLAPTGAAILLSSRRVSRTIVLTLFGGAALGVVAATLGVGFPITGNALIDFGMGPRTLPGVHAGAPAWLWTAISAVGGAGAAGLLLALVAGARHVGVISPQAGAQETHLFMRMRAALRAPEARTEATGATAWLLAVLVILILFAPTAVFYGPFFDRYLLPQLPFLLLLICSVPAARGELTRGGVAVAGALLAFSLAFSVGATHDYLAWQRVRWDCIEHLDERGIERSAIRAGFEVDNYPPPANGLFRRREKARWTLALSPAPRHDVRERLPVDTWLPFSLDELLLLERHPKHGVADPPSNH